MINLITSGEKQDWHIASFRKVLGANNCKGSGEIYTFYKNRQARCRKCVNNTIEIIELSWSLRATGNSSQGEWNIIFSKPLNISKEKNVSTVRVDFYMSSKKEKGVTMYWRTLSTCKSCPESIIELRSKK